MVEETLHHRGTTLGRKKIITAGCLLAVVTYYALYHAMRDAAGNQVDTFKSIINPVTKAPALTPLTADTTGNQVPAKEAPNPNVPLLVLLVFIQVIYVTMVYAPIAAYLVEAFPAKIRYSSFSLPYHIGKRSPRWPGSADWNLYALPNR